MTLVNNNSSLFKTNLYRNGVDQRQAGNRQGASGTTYCQNLLQTGLPRIQLDQNLTVNMASPVPAQANTLFTFLAQRFMMSYTNLNCQNLLNQPNPVAITTDGAGVAIAATFNAGGNNNGGGNTGGNNGGGNNNNTGNTNGGGNNTGGNNTPAATSTATPAASPTVDPAASPAVSPTASPAASPTAAPGTTPVASPTPDPNASNSN